MAPSSPCAAAQIMPQADRGTSPQIMTAGQIMHASRRAPWRKHLRQHVSSAKSLSSRACRGTSERRSFTHFLHAPGRGSRLRWTRGGDDAGHPWFGSRGMAAQNDVFRLRRKAMYGSCRRRGMCGSCRCRAMYGSCRRRAMCRGAATTDFAGSPAKSEGPCRKACIDVSIIPFSTTKRLYLTRP